MKMRNALLALALLTFGGYAHALSLTPTTIDGSLCDTSTDPACWSGTVPNNPKADDVETITGFTGDLAELYKADVADPVEESGSFSLHYTTTYMNDPLDPADATISWDGGSYIMCGDCFLLVKDGDQDPSWYIFDISSWDGQEDITLTGFWPAQGAISHIAIYGLPTNVPEPGILLLVAGGLLGIGGSLRMRRKIG